MAVELRLSGAAEHGYGVRHGGDRRQWDRRAAARGTPDRRQAGRRRATLRSLLFTALTLGFPQHVNPAMMALPLRPLLRAVRTPVPKVVTSIDSFEAVPPWRAYNELIDKAAARYDLDPDLIRSVMQTESAFNPMAVSPAGAMGLMQLMPELAEEFGITDPFDPEQNIMGGARYLRQLLNMHDGNVRLAVASYNAGPGAVARYGGRVPPFDETREYVKRVTHLLARAN
jgi:soluble lytic murein transglycosylase-like protein